MKNLPTAFQRSMMWGSLTAVSMAAIGALVVGLIYLLSRVIAFLQPILIPFAVAAVLAYLLEPVVVWLERRKLSRQRAVLLVFAAFSLVLALSVWLTVPTLVQQTSKFARNIPGYAERARDAAMSYAATLEKDYGIALLPHAPPNAAGHQQPPAEKPGATPAQPAPANPAPTTAPASAKPDADAESATPDSASTESEAAEFDLEPVLTGDWVRTALPSVSRWLWGVLRGSVGGFLGVFGFLLSFIIVPLYLYYFLLESAHIKKTWSDYLPLRSSGFKDELVSCLDEINGYLIAFFRGQVLVSLLNGVATAAGLMIIGLDFGLVIGLALCILGIMPYLGIALTWIPAVIIGAVQGGSSWIPGDPWWAMPLAVSVVFAVVQQIDAVFITPRILGEAVGLHPVTVIASVLVWSLLLGGLLGAILAVPLTASVKVLFQRYIWRARFAPGEPAAG